MKEVKIKRAVMELTVDEFRITFPELFRQLPVSMRLDMIDQSDLYIIRIDPVLGCFEIGFREDKWLLEA